MSSSLGANPTSPPLRAMRDELLTLADGSSVRLGDLPHQELRVLARILRRAAETAGSEDPLT